MSQWSAFEGWKGRIGDTSATMVKVIGDGRCRWSVVSSRSVMNGA
jgi:hypothetical protein